MFVTTSPLSYITPDHYVNFVGPVVGADVDVITEPKTKPKFDSETQKYKDGGQF